MNKAGLLHVQKGDKSIVKYIMYVFDTKVGSTEKMLLFSLKAIRQSNMHIVHHMDKSLLGTTAPLQFMDAPLQAKCKRKRASVHSTKTSSEIFLMLQEKISKGKTPPRMYVKTSKIFKKHLKEAKENKEREDSHSNRLGVELFSIGEVEGHHLLMLDSTAQDEDTYRIEDAEAAQTSSSFFPVSSRRRHSVLAPILTHESSKGLSSEKEMANLSLEELSPLQEEHPELRGERYEDRKIVLNERIAKEVINFNEEE